MTIKFRETIIAIVVFVRHIAEVAALMHFPTRNCRENSNYFFQFLIFKYLGVPLTLCVRVGLSATTPRFTCFVGRCTQRSRSAAFAMPPPCIVASPRCGVSAAIPHLYFVP
jgi:hypothetical protein